MPSPTLNSLNGTSAALTGEEADTLFGILQDMGKEAYVAVHEDLGAPVCRILVPGYSEVYSVEDLIWDNTNIALQYREDILNLHRLTDEQLESLVERPKTVSLITTWT